MPAELQKELEDTITSLKAQVSGLMCQPPPVLSSGLSQHALLLQPPAQTHHFNPSSINGEQML